MQITKMEETEFQKNLKQIEREGKVARISNSALSKFNINEGGSPLLFKMWMEGIRENNESKQMSIGKLIHSYFEDENIVEKFDIKKPSDTIALWVEKVFENEKDSKISEEELIIKIKEELSIFSNIKKKETIISKFITEGKNYLNYLRKLENTDKIVLSVKEYNELQNAIEGVKSNEEAYSLLRNGNKEIKVLFEDELTNLPMKSVIDNLIVDDDEKKIFITDLKTTNCGPYDLMNYFKERNYDRQIAFYYDSIISLIKNGSIPSDYEIECYIVNVSIPFKKSVVYKISNETLDEGRKKYRNLIDSIVIHKEMDFWDKTIMEKVNGFIKI